MPGPVPAARQAAGEPAHARARRGHPGQRRGWPEDLAATQNLVAALEVGRALAEQPGQDLQVFLEAPDQVVEGEPEGSELRLVPARPEAEDESTVRSLGEGLRLPHQLDRRSEGAAEHKGAQLQALGPGGEMGQEDHRLRAGPAPDALALDQDVVHHPGRVVTELLGAEDVIGHLGEALRPPAGELVGRDRHAHLHFRLRLTSRLESPFELP